MPKAPPLLPAEALHRVQRVARFDGFGVAVFAGLFALVSMSFDDLTGTAVGVIVAGAGIVELHGVTLLNTRDPRAMRWLIGGQFYLLLAILSYAAWRYAQPDPLLMRLTQAALTGDQRQTLRDIGLSETEFVRSVCRLVYVCLAFVTLIYQGGMIVYYLRRRVMVARAIVAGRSAE